MAYDFNVIEETTLKYWKDNDILKKIKKKCKGKKFYFLDGPPYTSGRIHLGTAWNQVMKDSILRYKRMRRFDVWDRGGYDMHGLPTAHKLQAKFNLKDKEDIKKFGVDKFVKECEKYSIEMMEQMNKDFDKLGVTLNHKDPYMPIKPEYIEGEWWLIKKAHEKKRLYEGKKVMPWCPNCATALAKHELEYKNKKDDSIFLKFKLKGDKNEYLIVWTTTPWTIAFNLGVMVNPEKEYVKAKVGGEIWIVAKNLANIFISSVAGKKFKILEEFKGEKMDGWEYEHPFYEELKKTYDKIKTESPNAFTVLLSKEYVDTNSGSGLVHCAPGCGPEDSEVGRAYGIKGFNELDEYGRYNSNMGVFSGWHALVDNTKFIKKLKDKGVLIEITPVDHEYAHCWRCHKPIVFRTTKQWFFKIEDLVPKMLKESEKIEYVPKSIKTRYQSWVKNIKDNSITRQRFWGTPLPIWRCDKCGDYVVVGSVSELKKLSGKVPENLHIPFIDEIKIKCKCGGIKKRVPDILDVWIDAGTASWNCLGFPRNKTNFKKYWPADLILEATEQTRLWFYMLHLVSDIAFDENCYNSMYAHGMLRDISGVKMSKSLGNIVAPKEVTDKYGVDTLRLYVSSIKAGEDMSFSWEEIKLKYRNLNILLNMVNYLLNYYPKLDKDLPSKLEEEDKWILSRLNSCIYKTTNALDAYQLEDNPRLVEKLILQLSREYIQYTRDRIGDKRVFRILLEVLINSLKMLSINCPFISEHLYLKLKEKYKFKEESIHMFEWPKFDKKKIDLKLEENFSLMKQILQEGLAQREKAKFGVRWPLPSLEVNVEDSLSKLKKLIMKQLNVKKINISKGKFKVKLNFKITPELEREGFSRELMRRIQGLRKKNKFKREDMIELNIDSKYSLNKFKKEIMAKVGAKSLSFGGKLYEISSLENIKGKEFKISFSKV